MNYESAEILKNIQMLKYKAAMIPIFIVLLSFITNVFFQLEAAKYFSILGLILYIFTIMRFRISRAHPPVSEKEVIFSPVFGKVISITDKEILIKKGIFQYADIRASECEINCEKKHIFTKQNLKPASLIGVIPWLALCKCRIPDDKTIKVAVGDNVEAGETILAEES